MSYEILVERSAQKSLAKISSPDRQRVIDGIRRLGEDPRPRSCRKLADREAWRLRIGRYRVIYEIHDDRLVVLVIALGHRREIYRKR